MRKTDFHLLAGFRQERKNANENDNFHKSMITTTPAELNVIWLGALRKFLGVEGVKIIWLYHQNTAFAVGMTCV